MCGLARDSSLQRAGHTPSLSNKRLAQVVREIAELIVQLRKESIGSKPKSKQTREAKPGGVGAARLERSILSSLSAVFEILNEMKVERVFEDYAVGGAMAVLFYAEPTRTYDLDVFVLLPRPQGEIVQLTPIYDWLKQRGCRYEAEHVLIHGVPVQFLPAYNELVEEAVREARVLDYEEVPVQVAAPEHLVALGMQAGGRKRRERAFQLLESGILDMRKLREIFSRHSLPLEILEDE